MSFPEKGLKSAIERVFQKSIGLMRQTESVRVFLYFVVLVLNFCPQSPLKDRLESS